MTSMICRVTILALLLAGGTASAQEAEFGPYFEGGFGRTHFDLGKANLDNWAEIPSGASSLDDGDNGYSLAVGFRFSRYLAFEAEYLDLGKTSYLVKDQGETARLELGSKGPALSMIGSLPLGNVLSLEGRAGLYFSQVDMTTFLVGTGLDILFFDEDYPLEALRSTDPGWMFGAGVAATFGHWSARVHYDYFNRKAAGLRDLLTGNELDSRAGRWTFGFRYSF
jgi:hypothetical protein